MVTGLEPLAALATALRLAAGALSIIEGVVEAFGRWDKKDSALFDLQYKWNTLHLELRKADVVLRDRRFAAELKKQYLHNSSIGNVLEGCNNVLERATSALEQLRDPLAKGKFRELRHDLKKYLKFHANEKMTERLHGYQVTLWTQIKDLESLIPGYNAANALEAARRDALRPILAPRMAVLQAEIDKRAAEYYARNGKTGRDVTPSASTAAPSSSSSGQSAYRSAETGNGTAQTGNTAAQAGSRLTAAQAGARSAPQRYPQARRSEKDPEEDSDSDSDSFLSRSQFPGAWDWQ